LFKKLPFLKRRESIDYAQVEQRSRQHVTHCAICNTPIDKDGVIDHHFPYFTTYNRCAKCIKVDGEFVPYCAVCGERVDVDEGGVVDKYFPYFGTNNRCSKCIHVVRINPKCYTDE